MRGALLAFVRLTIAVGVFVGTAALVAFLWDLAGGETERAFKLVFYLAGAGLFVFAILTRGAEARAGGMGSEITLERWFDVPEDERMRLNPTGVLVIAGLSILTIAVLIDVL